MHMHVLAAKVADLVLLMVDGSFGFEMETFEFLNMLQVSLVNGSNVSGGSDMALSDPIH